MKVLLTGAAGGLGSVALTQLRQAGHDVIATDRRMSRRSDPDLDISDLCDMNAVYRLMRGVDTVIHVGNIPNDSFPFDQTYIGNVTNNINVFQAAADRGVRRIIWASTIQVCSGNNFQNIPSPPLPYLPADGDLPAIPQNFYSMGKHHCELALEAISRWNNIEAVAIRFPALFRMEWIRGGHVRNSSLSERRRYGTRLDSLLWLTNNDAARLLVRCAEAEKLPGFRIYLPSADELMCEDPVRDVANEFFPDVPWRKPMDKFPGLCDTSRITADTGWQPLDNRQTVLDAMPDHMKKPV